MYLTGDGRSQVEDRNEHLKSPLTANSEAVREMSSLESSTGMKT